MATKTGTELKALAPKGATGMIVAELHRDVSDIMTDYHGYSTTRMVFLGWKMTTKESFPALRKAAATFPETAHLGPKKGSFRPRVVVASLGEGGNARLFLGSFSPYHTEIDGGNWDSRKFETLAEAEAWVASKAPLTPIVADGTEVTFRWKILSDEVEHRENYSMGAGNYLGLSKYSGWIVRSTSYYSDHDVYEIPEPAAPAKILPFKAKTAKASTATCTGSYGGLRCLNPAEVTVEGTPLCGSCTARALDFVV